MIVDQTDPTRAITPTLDGPVLAVLARVGHPLTSGGVAEQSVRGSEIGIRRCLSRLVDEGVVIQRQMGRNRVYEINRDHVAYDAIQRMANLRIEVWSRMRTRLQKWRPRPLAGVVFGSAARGDGNEVSDIDLLLVHPSFPGEISKGKKSLAAVLSTTATTAVLGTADVSRWNGNVDTLRVDVQKWTGNPLQVVDLSIAEWTDLPKTEGLWVEILKDGIQLVSSQMLSMSISGTLK